MDSESAQTAGELAAPTATPTSDADLTLGGLERGDVLFELFGADFAEALVESFGGLVAQTEPGVEPGSSGERSHDETVQVVEESLPVTEDEPLPVQSDAEDLSDQTSDLSVSAVLDTVEDSQSDFGHLGALDVNDEPVELEGLAESIEWQLPEGASWLSGEIEPIGDLSDVTDPALTDDAAVRVTLSEGADVLVYEGGALEVEGFELGTDKLIISGLDVDPNDTTPRVTAEGDLLLRFSDGESIILIGVLADAASESYA